MISNIGGIGYTLVGLTTLNTDTASKRILLVSFFVHTKKDIVEHLITQALMYLNIQAFCQIYFLS